MAVSYAAVIEETDKGSVDFGKRKTLQKAVIISGTGLFTSEKTSLTISPGLVGSGIQLQRTDLPSCPIIKADLDHVIGTPRCTILGADKVTIHTVEHVLAALAALEIDDALLQLSGPEVPILDGSALRFVEKLKEAGIIEQEQNKEVYYLQNPVYWSNGPVSIVALPAEEYTVSYTLHYPHSKTLGTQYLKTIVRPEEFMKEIAPSRTFCLYEEIAPFIENGLIKGGGLDNAVIIKNDVVLNPEGLRFADEAARHKLLDLIGDLSLITQPFVAHVIAICSGHASNIAFARKLHNQIKKEKS